jgi:hypothetical protein
MVLALAGGVPAPGRRRPALRLGWAVVVLVPLLVAVAGCFTYLLAEGKAAELGRIAFACGFFLTIWGMADRAVRLFP